MYGRRGPIGYTISVKSEQLPSHPTHSIRLYPDGMRTQGNARQTTLVHIFEFPDDMGINPLKTSEAFNGFSPQHHRENSWLVSLR